MTGIAIAALHRHLLGALIIAGWPPPRSASA